MNQLLPDIEPFPMGRANDDLHTSEMIDLVQDIFSAPHELAVSDRDPADYMTTSMDPVSSTTFDFDLEPIPFSEAMTSVDTGSETSSYTEPEF